MGRNHAAALRRARHWELVGVVDPLEPDWADVPWEDVLDRGLRRWKPDAAIVAVPTALHAPVARACLARGCHVLLEKPICADPVEARSLAADFASGGRKLFGGHSERFHGVFRELVQLLDPGAVVSIHCRRFGPAPRLAPEGGVVLDLAIHDIDLLERSMGGLVVESAVDAGAKWDVRGRTESGASIRIEVGYGAERARSWTIRCRGGEWAADFLGRSLRWTGNDGRSLDCPVAPGDALELEHRMFRLACAGHEDPSDLEPQLRAVELADSILREENLSVRP